MSATTSFGQRAVPAPIRSPALQTARKAPPPIPTEAASLPPSKSQQLALAIAADAASLHSDANSTHAAMHFRPDSLWSEGGADVVWHGNGVDQGLPSPALPSQYRNTYASSNAGATESYHQGEFADADEGYDQDDTQPNFRFNGDDTIGADDDNTTFTTLSTGSSAKKGSSFASQQASGMPLSTIKNGVNAPTRPHRKAPRPSPNPDASLDDGNRNSFVDEDDDAASRTFGHASRASIGSSIWAGRGAKTAVDPKDHWPPMPDMPNDATADREGAGGHPGYRPSFDEAASVYSQGAASEWDVTSPRQRAEAQHYLEQTPPLDRLRHLAGENGVENSMSSPRDDDFEMMDTQSIYEGRNSVASSSNVHPLTAEPERRLADGTVVPKMPPVPTQYNDNASSQPIGKNKNAAPLSRTKKGRRQRSPILSYADGEEEEARLVQEREARDSLQTATSLGPRLKKNSPAPWEMDDEMEQRDGGAGGLAMSARPSMDHILGAGIKQPTNWARQSVEQFRNRGGGGSAAPSSNSNGTLSTSKSTNATTVTATTPTNYANVSPAPAFMSANNRTVSGSSSQGVAPGPTEEDHAQPSEAARRGRTKSMSGSAAGMLKGLGLATGSSSSSTPQKKQSSSRLAMAFRSNKSTAAAPAVPSTSLAAPNSEMGARKMSRGISSDDYAHMTTSPSMLQSHGSLSVATSPYMANSRAHSHSSLSQRSDLQSEKGSPLPPASPIPPIPATKRAAATASPPTTAHGTTMSADSHSMGGSSSSHAAAVRNRAEIMDVIAASKRGPSSSSATDTTADSSTPNTPSMQNFKHPTGLGGSSNPASPQKQAFGYKNASAAYSLADQRSVAPAASSTAIKSSVPPRQSSASSEGGLSAPRSQDSQPTIVGRGNDLAANASGMVRLPSVGAHEGVPYKLISLEEARAQQHKHQQSGPGPRGGEDAASIPTSTSDKTIPDSGERERNLKTKKSGGFLRRFAKERSETSPMPAHTDGFGPLPSFATSAQMQQAQQLQAPPTLSVRPMSSMFTGLAPGLFDSLSVGEQIQEGDEGGSSDLLAAMPAASPNTPLPDRLSPTAAQFRGAGMRSPRSPAITLASVDSNASAGDYYDAIERPQQPPTAKTSSSSSASAAARGGGASLAGLSPAANVVRRHSTDSSRSDDSSALGLVSGFPALPTTGHGATAAGLEGQGSPSLARATRQRALEIEAKMTELHGELIKLRSLAIDGGFARPLAPASSNGGASPNPQLLTPEMSNAALEVLSDVETPPMPQSSMLGGGDVVEAVSPSPSAIAAADALMTPIPPCTQCGCLCADQKRLQSLNELAILKGISVLDRGRALKPLAGQNGSKFGGYLDR